MKQGRSTGRPTRAEAEWIEAVKSAGCLCCIARGFPHDSNGPLVEAHHLLSGGIRRGHLFTVGLCQWHHRGRLIVSGWDHADHRHHLGPSLAEGSVPFHAAFGSDDDLYAAQQRLLDWRDVA